jgi:opacity protein-like surface antigen
VGVRGAGIYNRRGMVNNYNRIYLYLFAGAGGVLSSATVKDLNNDGLEPVENPGYFPGSQYSFAFPLGAGFKFSIDPRWSVGVELGYQFTLSDKLDGYAPAASQHNDSYYLLSVKGVYRIRNDKNGRPIFNKYYR